MRGSGSSTHTVAGVTSRKGETGLLHPARTRPETHSPEGGSLPGWKEPGLLNDPTVGGVGSAPLIWTPHLRAVR